MIVEEELVIPTFEDLKVEIRGGGAHYYKLEHKKLDELLGRIELELESLAGREVTRAREVIPLLKQELSFEHVMEHHETRENYALYPTLAERLSAVEQQALWDAMQSRADEARAAQASSSK
jgi:hemerythrin-like domain-containing protein